MVIIITNGAPESTKPPPTASTQDKTNTTADEDAKNEDADEEVLSYQEENAPDEFVIQEGPRIFDSDGKTDNHDVDILGKPWWTLVWTK
jgi:hypothetical protein